IDRNQVLQNIKVRKPTKKDCWWIHSSNNDNCPRGTNKCGPHCIVPIYLNRLGVAAVGAAVAVPGERSETLLQDHEEAGVERLQDVRAVGRQAKEDDALFLSRLHHLQAHRRLVAVEDQQQRTLLCCMKEKIFRPPVKGIRWALSLVAHSSWIGLGVDNKRRNVLSSCVEASQDRDVVPGAWRWLVAQTRGLGEDGLPPAQLVARLATVVDLARRVAEPVCVCERAQQTKELIHRFLPDTHCPPTHNIVCRLNSNVLFLPFSKIEPPRLAHGNPCLDMYKENSTSSFSSAEVMSRAGPLRLPGVTRPLTLSPSEDLGTPNSLAACLTVHLPDFTSISARSMASSKPWSV
ncbi:hypothetical protein CCH79_00002036, partial [Gambusia affinis]